MKEQDLVCYLYVILYIYAKTGLFEAKNDKKRLNFYNDFLDTMLR